MPLIGKFNPPTSIPSRVPEDERAEVTKVDLLIKEAAEFRAAQGPTGLSEEDLWERNLRRYIGDHRPGKSVSPVISEEGKRDRPVPFTQRLTINRTQNAIISQRAVAFSRPESIRWEPVETTDEPVVFVKPGMGRRVIQALDAGQVDAEAMGLGGLSRAQLGGQEPIPGPDALVLEPLLGLNGVHRMTDDEIARGIQRIWDVHWGRAQGPYYTATNELYKAIFGHQPFLLEWIPERATFRLSNPHILNVWVDPTGETEAEMEYVGLDTVVSLDQAKAAWPRLAGDLEHAASSGELDTRGLRLGAPFRINFRRQMVLVRTVWIRHQEVPMTPEEALDAGVVLPGDAQGNPVSAQGVRVEGTQVTITRPSGESVPGTLVKADTGAHTRPDLQNWPTTFGIKQVQVLPQIDRRVESRRCPYLDIPLGWNKNIPKPYSPFGQGEPERLEDLSQAIDRLFTVLDRHAQHYQSPMEFWPETLYEDIKSRQKTAPYSRPGRIIPVRQDIYQLMVQIGGRQGFGVINQIPAIPSFYVQLLSLLLQEHDRLAGFVEVLQGAPPGNDTSGRAIEALQAAAQGPVGVKSAFTEWMLERIARLGLDALQKWLPESEWAKVLSEYSLPALRYMLDRIRSTEWNVKVSVVTGRGVNETFDRQRAAELYMEGNPARLIDRRTAMEMSGISDPEAVEQRIEQENQEGMSGAPPQGQRGE